MTPAIGTVVNVGVLAGGGDGGDPSDVAAIAEALDVVRAAAGDACRLVPELNGGPAAVRLWTTLDAGLDRCAAKAALARGMRLSVVLAGTRARCGGTTEPGAEAEGAAVLDWAESVLELCAHGEAAQAQAEKLVLGQADVLVVAAPLGIERARPGTLLVANAAVAANVPLFLVGPGGSGAHAVVWQGWTSYPHPMGDVLAAPRRIGSAALADAVGSLLRPPPSVDRLREFLDEPLDDAWRRPEYAWFVRLLGPAPSATPEPRRDTSPAPDMAGDRLAAIEARAEVLGAANGSSYRSQFVTRFTVVALLSLFLNGLWAVTSDAVVVVEAIQAAIIGFVLFDSRLARRKRWHERWLEYRYLRERLRTVRFLRRVGAPLPDLGSAAGAPRDSWMDWLATRLARSVGVASARFDAAHVRALADALDRDDLGGQLDYHARATEVLSTIARRLGRGSRALLVLSLALAVALALGARDVVVAVCPVPISAGVKQALPMLPFLLPPVALALEGIASRGDFERLVQRSESTGTALAAIRAQLREPGLGFGRLFALSWHVAAAMAADVAEWRFVFEARH